VCRGSLVAVALFVALGLAACTDQTEGISGLSTSATTASTVSGHGGPFSVTIAASGDVLAHAAVTRDAQENAGGRCSLTSHR